MFQGRSQQEDRGSAGLTTWQKWHMPRARAFRARGFFLEYAKLLVYQGPSILISNIVIVIRSKLQY